jgi:hypothetical protein
MARKKNLGFESSRTQGSSKRMNDISEAEQATIDAAKHDGRGGLFQRTPRVVC